MVNCNCDACKGIKVRKCCDKLDDIYSYSVEHHKGNFSLEVNPMSYDGDDVTLDNVTHCPFCGKKFELEESN